ncbi:hypothetical protein D3C73_1300290 [compost metagenome]
MPALWRSADFFGRFGTVVLLPTGEQACSVCLLRYSCSGAKCGVKQRRAPGPGDYEPYLFAFRCAEQAAYARRARESGHAIPL